VNLGCDTSLQRSADTFLFQLNTGAAGESSSLLSPAAILPATSGAVGSTTLTLNASGGNNSNITMNGTDSSITMDATDIASIALTGLGRGSVLYLNSSAPGSENAIHFSDPASAGIAVYQNTVTPTQLAIGNDTTGTNVAQFNQATNAVVLGIPATNGTITLNSATSISDSVGGANQLILSPTSATASLIVQDPVGGTGTISIGPDATQAGTLQVSNVPRVGIANYVTVGSNGGTAAGLVLTGAQGSSPFTGIFTDTAAGTGGQLNLSSNNAGGSILSIRDNGLNVTLPIDPNFTSNSATLPSIITGSINGGTALVTGNYYPLPNNPPALAACTGLYCIMLNQNTSATAIINNGQVSVLAYWNGASSSWTFGGSSYGSPLTGGSVHIGFGITSTNKTTLYVGYGATDNGCILSYVMVPMYQSLSI